MRFMDATSNVFISHTQWKAWFESYLAERTAWLVTHNYLAPQLQFDKMLQPKSFPVLVLTNWQDGSCIHLSFIYPNQIMALLGMPRWLDTMGMLTSEEIKTEPNTYIEDRVV